MTSPKSILRGPTDTPLINATIPQLLHRAVEKFGPQDCMIFPHQNIRYTYREFSTKVDALAAGFLALGLNPGDRVGIWSPNRIEWVLTQFATARAGLILVNINPAYRLSEVEYALNKVTCKALVLAKSFKSSMYLEMIQTLAPELETCAAGHLNAAKLPHLRNVIVMGNAAKGTYAFDAVPALATPDHDARLGEIDATLSPNDPINIQFTSGTTGAPKGATLTHHNIVNNAGFTTDRINLGPTDRLCVPVPLYHCFGMVMGVLGAITKGAALVFPDEGFDPITTLQAISDERCTAVYGVPTMFVAMLQDLETGDFDVSSLRTGIMAGAPCPVDVMERVNTQMNLHEMTICYGMTETAPVSFQSFVDDPIGKRCGTVGRIHPHLEVKIIDENGNPVAVGETGELCTKGYSVMDGYWGEPEKTADSIIDGWMHTGDLATLDDAGFCSIVGRLKDMIIRGGENIYPREIEEFLFRHPQISAVQVFGIPHEKLGEEVCAWVIAKPGETPEPQEIRDFCKGQIAHYKIPAHVRIVGEIPMTITGKPQKFVMRDAMVTMMSEGG